MENGRNMYTSLSSSVERQVTNVLNTSIFSIKPLANFLSSLATETKPKHKWICAYSSLVVFFPFPFCLPFLPADGKHPKSYIYLCYPIRYYTHWDSFAEIIVCSYFPRQNWGKVSKQFLGVDGQNQMSSFSSDSPSSLSLVPFCQLYSHWLLFIIFIALSKAPSALQ